MHHVRKSEIVSYSPSEMFDLVADVDRYREFLPFCRNSRVLTREGGEELGEIQVAYGPIKAAFVTRNRYQPYEKIEIRLVKGPLKFLEGSWRFESIPQGGTRVSLDLRFELRHKHADRLLGVFLDNLAAMMVSSFKRRAGEIRR